MATSAFDTLFTRHAFASYAKQVALSDTLESAGTWDLDLSAGSLTFTGGLSFKVCLLGSYDAGAGTWLWGWANRNMNLSEETAAHGEAMRAAGRSQGIPEFHEPQTHDEENFCHRLAMIATGETGAGAYYRAPYDGGAAYLTLREALPDAPERHKLGRVQRVIAECVSTFTLNHRDGLEAYFATEKYDWREDEKDEIITSLEDGDLRLRFDSEGRITEMKSLLRASTKPQGGFFNRLFRKEDTA